MVVLIGFILLVAVMLCWLTHRVNQAEAEIKRVTLENKLYLNEIKELNNKLDGKETKKSEVIEATEKRIVVYSD